MSTSSRVAPYQHLDAEGSPCWTKDCSRGNRAVTALVSPRPDFGLRGLDAGFRPVSQPSFDAVLNGDATAATHEPAFPFAAQMRNESIAANLSTLEQANDASVKPAGTYYAKDIAKQVLPSLPTALLHAVTSPVTGMPDLVRTLGLKVGIGSKDAYFERKKAQAQQETTGRLLRVIRAQYASTSLARKQQEELEELSSRVGRALQEDATFKEVPQAVVDEYLASAEFEGYLVQASNRILSGVSDAHRVRIATALGQMAPWRSANKSLKKQFFFDKTLEYNDYHVGIVSFMNSTLRESFDKFPDPTFKDLDPGYKGNVGFMKAMRQYAFNGKGNWDSFKPYYRQVVADEMVAPTLLDNIQHQPWVNINKISAADYDTKPWRRDLLENGSQLLLFVNGEQFGGIRANSQGFARNLDPKSLLK